MKQLSNKINIFLITAIIILIAIIFVLLFKNKETTLNKCIENAKLVNETKNQVNCSNLNNITYECDGIYVNDNFSNWNYQEELKACLNRYLK